MLTIIKHFLLWVWVADDENHRTSVVRLSKLLFTKLRLNLKDSVGPGSDTSMQLHTYMSLVVLTQIVHPSIPLQLMILKTGFQICLVIKKRDPPTHYK